MNDDVGSIYFGGGTPSILTETDLEKILNEIHKKFKISNHAEITIECNPDDLTSSKLYSYKKIEIDHTFPKYIVENKKKFEKWIL